MMTQVEGRVPAAGILTMRRSAINCADARNRGQRDPRRRLGTHPWGAAIACITVSREGPFTLLHRPSGAVFLFACPKDAVEGLRKLGVRRLADSARPDWLAHIANPRTALACLPWQLTNVYGEIVTLAGLAAWMPKDAGRRRYEPRARYRVDPVPGISRPRLGPRFNWREPPTGALLREISAREDDEPAPREARRRWAIPVAWDDRVRHFERNWKSQRRMQWKTARPAARC